MKKVAILLEEMYNEHELWYPYWRIKEAGYEPWLVDTGRLQSYRGENGHLEARPDKSAREVTADQLAGLIVPGGFGPDYLRRNEEIIRLIREVDKAGKPLGVICHAGWVLVTADILRSGRTLTSFKTLKADLTNAGAKWVDQEVVADKNLITCRQPQDLPAFMPVYLDHLGRA